MNFDFTTFTGCVAYIDEHTKHFGFKPSCIMLTGVEHAKLATAIEPKLEYNTTEVLDRFYGLNWIVIYGVPVINKDD